MAVKKIFENIAEMTNEFETFCKDANADEPIINQDAFRYWYLRIALAQAQQMAVISSQLGALRKSFLSAAAKAAQ